MIDEVRIPARYHRVCEISAKRGKHPDEPGDAKNESSNADPPKPVSYRGGSPEEPTWIANPRCSRSERYQACEPQTDKDGPALLRAVQLIP